MKLLGIRTARSIWLFPGYFLNPTGMSLRGLTADFKQRYGFRRTPDDDPPTKENPGARWTLGEFQTKRGAVVIKSLAFHDDGIVLDMMSSTEDGDAFADDALGFLKLTSLSELPAKRVYLSEINVQYRGEPNFFTPRFDELKGLVSSALADDIATTAHFISLHLGLDQSLSKRAPFKLEREINTPVAEHRYYSAAPFHTGQHLKILEKIEEFV